VNIRVSLFCVLLLTVCSVSLGQTCSNTAPTNEVICTVPQLFGPGGLTLPNPRHRAHFTDLENPNAPGFQAFRPINTSIGEELATLPLASGGSGVSFTFDRALGIVTATEGSLGPILTDRAETIGKKRVNIGAAYQYFGFDSIDGIDLHHLPQVVGHVQFTLPNGVRPDFENDYLTTDNRVKLNLHQVVLFGIIGLSSRVDFSVAIPFESVHFKVSSDATIVRTVPCELNQTCSDSSAEFGEYHFFDGSSFQAAFTSTNKIFTNSNNGAGLGDIVLRGKGVVYKAEKTSVAVGLDLRVPTGDAENFLGAGAVGVTPFVAASYRTSVISPHVWLGYQWNGSSVLAGNPSTATGGTGDLPHAFIYQGGADIRASSRVTVVADLLGERVFDANRLKRATFTDVHGAVSPNLVPFKASYSANAIATGIKVRTVGYLVLTGNLTTRLDSGGLRADVVPLFGLSYVF